jgi:hypothetical protein
MINRIALTLVFTISLLTYFASDLTLAVQLGPLVLFACVVVLRVGFSKSLLHASESLLTVEGLFVVVFLPLFVLGPSLASSIDKSFQYALLVTGCLILARLYMTLVPIQEVMEAFF